MTMLNLLLAPVYAAPAPPAPPSSMGGGAVKTTIDNPTSATFTDFGDLFGFVISLIMGIGWALVFVMLALGFVQYVMSKGEKTAVDGAQKWLTYAVIGGVGLFFIGFFRRVLPQLLGVNELNTGGNFSDF